LTRHPAGLAIALMWGAALAAASADVAAQAAATPASAAATTAAGRPALTVQTVRPQAARLAERLAANGSVAAWQEASVSAETGGLRLASLHAQVGDRVKRGQLLAQMAVQTLQADLAQARAGLLQAQAEREQATANATRARELQPTGVLSTQQVQQALTAERVAEARVQAQQALLDTQQLRLNQAQVRAPVDGIVIARSATLGAVPMAGQELFRLIRDGRLEWRAEVASADAGRIKPGHKATLQLPGGASASGRVRQVAPTVDATTRNAVVFVDLEPGTALKAGMFASGELLLGERQGLSVPQSAVVLRDGFAWVFRVGSDGRVQSVKVKPGARLGDRIEILEGLDAAASIVAAGGGFLADGDRVRVVNP
jgi:RND family efflux transporter MFP subunit